MFKPMQAPKGKVAGKRTIGTKRNVPAPVTIYQPDDEYGMLPVAIVQPEVKRSRRTK